MKKVLNLGTTSESVSTSVSKEEKAMFTLNISQEKNQELEKEKNQIALELFDKLSKNGYYMYLQPRISKNGEAYIWVGATKKDEDREEFSLYVNEKILDVIISVLVDRSYSITDINANDLESFNEKVNVFELELYLAEKAQGKTMKKTHTTYGLTISSFYKKGVIIYRPYSNPEFKAYLNKA